MFVLGFVAFTGKAATYLFDDIYTSTSHNNYFEPPVPGTTDFQKIGGPPSFNISTNYNALLYTISLTLLHVSTNGALPPDEITCDYVLNMQQSGLVSGGYPFNMSELFLIDNVIRSCPPCPPTDPPVTDDSHRTLSMPLRVVVNIDTNGVLTGLASIPPYPGERVEGCEHWDYASWYHYLVFLIEIEIEGLPAMTLLPTSSSTNSTVSFSYEANSNLVHQIQQSNSLLNSNSWYLAVPDLLTTNGSTVSATITPTNSFGVFRLKATPNPNNQ